MICTDFRWYKVVDTVLPPPPFSFLTYTQQHFLETEVPLDRLGWWTYMRWGALKRSTTLCCASTSATGTISTPAVWCRPGTASCCHLRRCTTPLCRPRSPPLCHPWPCTTPQCTPTPSHRPRVAPPPPPVPSFYFFSVVDYDDHWLHGVS